MVVLIDCHFAPAQLRMPDVILPPLSGDTPVAAVLVNGQSSGTGISAERMSRDVSFLADEVCQGRGFGTTGAMQAASYIAGRFAAAGLQPEGGSWYQTFSAGGKVGRNVVGIRPGRNGRYVVIGAYLDGIGVLDGKFYPGADSDASGVAALISLAEALPRDPSTGIVFVVFDGHTSGYAGAKAFIEKHKSMKIGMMVSLDILGSTLSPIFLNRPNYLIMLGGARFERTMDSLNDRDINLFLGFDYYGSRDFTDLFYRKIGDQTVFLSRGISSVVFTSGITMNTNKRIDLPETLDFNIMALRVELIRRWLHTQL